MFNIVESRTQGSPGPRISFPHIHYFSIYSIFPHSNSSLPLRIFPPVSPFPTYSFIFTSASFITPNVCSDVLYYPLVYTLSNFFLPIPTYTLSKKKKIPSFFPSLASRVHYFKFLLTRHLLRCLLLLPQTLHHLCTVHGPRKRV